MSLRLSKMTRWIIQVYMILNGISQYKPDRLYIHAVYIHISRGKYSFCFLTSTTGGPRHGGDATAPGACRANFMFFFGQALLTEIGVMFWQFMACTVMESQKITFVLRLGSLDNFILCKIVQCLFEVYSTLLQADTAEGSSSLRSGIKLCVDVHDVHELERSKWQITWWWWWWWWYFQ